LLGCLAALTRDEIDDEGVEALNKQRKKRVEVFHYPGTAGGGLTRPEKPKKKKRNRKDLDVAGALSSKKTPFVVNIVGVTTLSNKYKGSHSF
jgi:hypothetical protein